MMYSPDVVALVAAERRRDLERSAARYRLARLARRGRADAQQQTAATGPVPVPVPATLRRPDGPGAVPCPEPPGSHISAA